MFLAHVGTYIKANLLLIPQVESHDVKFPYLSIEDSKIMWLLIYNEEANVLFFIVNVLPRKLAYSMNKAIV